MAETMVAVGNGGFECKLNELNKPEIPFTSLLPTMTNQGELVNQGWDFKLGNLSCSGDKIKRFTTPYQIGRIQGAISKQFV